MLLTAAAALAALPAAGCGVFGDSVSADPGSFSACMAENGYSSSTDPDDVDAIARAAGIGTAEAEIDGNRVTIAFERSGDDAKRTVEAYKARPASAGGAVDELLRRDGSIVVRWELPPNDAQRSAVDHCLSAE